MLENGESDRACCRKVSLHALPVSPGGKRWKMALRGLQSEFHSMQRKMRFKIFWGNKVPSSACTGQISQTHRCWGKSEEGAGSVPSWGLQCHRGSLSSSCSGPQSRWEPWPRVSLSPWFSVSWVIWKHVFFFYYYFFDVDHLKSLYWICCNIASILWFGFLGREAWGILAPQLGIKPTPSALEGEVLTSGPQGKSLIDLIFKSSLSWLQNCMESTEISHMPSASTDAQPSPLSGSLPEWDIYEQTPTLSPRIHSLRQGPLLVVLWVWTKVPGHASSTIISYRAVLLKFTF